MTLIHKGYVRGGNEARTVNRDAALRNGVQAGHSSGIGTADGERKFVTIMFVDMAQSSRLVVGQDPEDADEWLLAPVQLMIDAVQTRDLPLVQACAMIFCTVYIVLIFIADMVSTLSNPRLRHPK